MKNLLEHGSEVGRAASNGVPPSNEQTDPFPAYPGNIDVAHVKHVVLLSEKSPCSKSAKNDNEEETLKCKENASIGTRLRADSPMSTGKPALREKKIASASVEQGQSISSKTDSCTSVQSIDSWKHSQHGYGNSSPNHKVEESTDSVVSEEDRADGNRPSQNMGTPNMRIHAYDGSISSCDDITSKHERYMLLSRRTFRNPKLCSNSTKNNNGKEDISMENNKMADSVSHFPPRILSSKSSSVKCDSAVTDGSNAGQENLLDSKNFYSSKKELESNPPPRSLPRDPTSFGNLACNILNGIPSTRFANNETVRMELLRKVDEMREHLTRPYTEVKRGNQRLHIRGTGEGSNQSVSCNHESEKVLKCCHSNISHCNSSLYGKVMTAKRHQSSLMPWSGQGGSSCLHHHPEHWCNSVELPPSICSRACTSHMGHEPCTAASSSCCKDCLTLCSHNGQTIDYHLHKPHPKEKGQILKRHCRPVSGGAPFVTCNNCLQLLHLPADFLVLRGRRHKLKCGACSKVLIFLSHDGGHIVPHNDAQLDPHPCNIDNATEHYRKDNLTVNHGCLQGDPVSYSEEYGPPFSKSYSTDDEPVAYILSSLEHDKMLGRQILGSPLHRLMGYDSASELIYQPCDEDDGYESTATSNFYTMFDKIHFSEGYGGAVMASLQRRSAVGCSPEHAERDTRMPNM